MMTELWVPINFSLAKSWLLETFWERFIWRKTPLVHSFFLSLLLCVYLNLSNKQKEKILNRLKKYVPLTKLSLTKNNFISYINLKNLQKCTQHWPTTFAAISAANVHQASTLHSSYFYTAPTLPTTVHMIILLNTSPPTKQ